MVVIFRLCFRQYDNDPEIESKYHNHNSGISWVYKMTLLFGRVCFFLYFLKLSVGKGFSLPPSSFFKKGFISTIPLQT